MSKDQDHQAPAASFPSGQEEIGGRLFMRDAKGALLEVSMVKDADKFRDATVRDLVARAIKQRDELVLFRDLAFSDAEAYLTLSAERYGVKKGGAKGNVTIETFDSTQRIQIQVADQITFGEELQHAKALIDECVQEWGMESRPEILAMVTSAFRVDKEGRHNVGALLSLKRLNITDERWIRAMQALNDSIKVSGSKRYIRFHVRPNPQAAWEEISLHAATA